MERVRRELFGWLPLCGIIANVLKSYGCWSFCSICLNVDRILIYLRLFPGDWPRPIRLLRSLREKKFVPFVPICSGWVGNAVDISSFYALKKRALGAL